MIFGLLKKWFGKKKQESEEKKSHNPHPSFPSIPLGIRLGGIVKFKPSGGSYFLLNEDKLLTKLPDDPSQVIVAISQFSLFGLTIYRAYINGSNSYLQLHYEGKELLDILFFTSAQVIELRNNPKLEKDWKQLIGDKDIITPNGIKFIRDWSVEEEGHVESVHTIESYFPEPWNLENIYHNMMLYARVLEGGNPDHDIEYLLTSMIEHKGVRKVKIESAIRLDASDLEIF
jgi:hypothetical protein